MKSIQVTAIILWVVIFVVAAFVLGQFLSSKGILDITSFITGTLNEQNVDAKNNDKQSNDPEEDAVISKIGQETVRIGQNIATEYFSTYYKEYVNYIMQSTSYNENQKNTITSDLASDYVFYAVSNQIDADKYVSDSASEKISISEGEINSFADKMFAQSIAESYKSSNGYDKQLKHYNISKSNDNKSYTQELVSIENITSNQIKLEFYCKEVVINENKTEIKEKKQIVIYAVYRGGRYIVTDVEKNEK